MAKVLRTLTGIGALVNAALTAHAAYNTRRAIRPRARGAVHERVSVLIPARNEAHRISPTIHSVLAQIGVPDLEILVLDDGSTDGTAELVEDIAQGDPRLRVIRGGDQPLPQGWLGKPWACQRLADAATGTALVFLDADVVLAPDAVAASVTVLRDIDAGMISPWPREATGSIGERIAQPMVNWAWLTLMPIAMAERFSFASLAAANGQFLVFDAQAYIACGGHASVAGEVIEDTMLMQSVRRQGFQALPVHGSELATCRMYASGREVYEGFAKSTWSLMPPAPLALGALAGASIVYFLPPIAMIASRDPRTRAYGTLGYGAMTAGRAIVARSVGERVWPDSLAMPLSIAAFIGIITSSSWRHRHGTLAWKGRGVDPTRMN